MILTVFLTLAVVGQGPHWDAMTSANETASMCSIGQGIRLDDNRTSPDVVARAAIAACYQELLQLDDAVKRNADIEIPTVPDIQKIPLVQDYVRNMRKRIEDLVIQAILEQRIKNAPNK